MFQNELFHDACVIIEQAQRSAYQAVNETLIKRNWLLGMRIQHEVLNDQRAEYGEQVVKNLSVQLVGRYDKSFSERNLYHFVDFYKLFPELFHAVSGISAEEQILQSLTAKCPIRLSWTHYSIIRF